MKVKMITTGLHKKFRLIIYLGCIFSVSIVVIIGIMSMHYLNEQDKLAQLMDRNYKVIAGINRIQSRLNQISKSTNAVDEWLAGMSLSNANIDKSDLLREFALLDDILSADRSQQKRMTLLKSRISELFAIWQSDNTTPASSKLDIYRQRIQEDGKMEEVRNVVNDVNHAEQQLLLQRRIENKQLTEQIKWVAPLAILLVLAVVISLVAVIINELKYRRNALEKEQEISKLKSSFVSLASHEFRTPLSSVLLSENLIRRYLEKSDTQNVLKHCAKIESSVKNLITILEDFLSLEKLESGKVQPAYHELDLRALGQDIVDDMQVMVKSSQQLSYQHLGSEDPVLLDEHLIKNSIINLVSNAIKYAGDNASIFVRTEISPEKVTITVGDNGIGISEKDQKNLFKPFFRVNGNGNIPGTGLGLNIVMRYVKLMKGSLNVSSRPNEETLFTMSFQHTDDGVILNLPGSKRFRN
ncbi:MAG: hypothetical protein JSU01_06985 [Bacteroidetes bacterium]|nr:hypothetical protein [Bacteroidota bacterium]